MIKVRSRFASVLAEREGGGRRVHKANDNALNDIPGPAPKGISISHCTAQFQPIYYVRCFETVAHREAAGCCYTGNLSKTRFVERQRATSEIDSSLSPAGSHAIHIVRGNPENGGKGPRVNVESGAVEFRPYSFDC